MSLPKFSREHTVAEKIRQAVSDRGGKALWNEVISVLDYNDVRALNPSLEYAKENGMFYRSLEPRTDEKGKIQLDLYLTLTNPRPVTRLE